MPEAFNFLQQEDVGNLCKHIAPLVYMQDTDEYAKRFDNFMYSLILAHINGLNTFVRAKNNLIETAEALTRKTTIPQVNTKLTEIKQVLTDAYWGAEDITVFEQTRKDLRELMQFIVRPSKPVVYTDLTDKVTMVGEGQTVSYGTSFESYKKKVNRFIEENANDIAIYKLKHNEPLTTAQLEGLQNTFLHDLGTQEDYRKEFGKTPLGILIRTIAGMDEEAIRKEFANFINSQGLNQQQIVFLDKIVAHIKNNGYVETPGVLLEAPFDNPLPMFDLFEQPQIMELMKIVNSFKENAMVAV